MVRTKQREVLQLIDEYAQKAQIVPPVALDELTEYAQQLPFEAADYGVSSEWVIIMLHNAIWRETVSSIPAHRKLFLLPRCLKNATKCRAMTDELGLICEQCGSCNIGSLTDEAEKLGMMTLVSEGSPIVRSVIESGAADAIIGVSCMNSLKKVFPHMVNYGVPGIAIALDNDGCVNTRVDEMLVRQFLYMKAEQGDKNVLNSHELEEETKALFSDASLDEVMGPCLGAPQRIARKSLQGKGKRFRPFLCLAVYRCLADNHGDLPLFVKKMALAVECFHKASLIHDDIEDEDTQRDGVATLHTEEGLAVAINSGDLLLGEGYRLISEVDAPVDIAALLRVASAGHLALCVGQGDELLLTRDRKNYTVEQIIAIFKGKTAPAFEVALVMGAICAGADAELCQLLSQYSESFGIAYQIYDDITDFQNGQDAQEGRLSIMLALGHEQLPEEEDILNHMNRALAYKQAAELYEQHREAAYHSLRQLRNGELKRLLFRITTRILKDVS